MAIEIKIPIPDQTTEEVRIVTWCKAIGDAVKKGDVILEIETDKAVMEVESIGDGVLLEQLVEADDMVPVGQVVGFIGQASEEVPGVDAEPAKADKGVSQPDEKTPAESTFTRKDVELDSSDLTFSGALLHNGKLLASPNAKRLAKELGVDINTVVGTGPNGRVTGKDITEFAKNKPSPDYSPTAGQPQPGTEVQLTKMRRAIGINLQKSSRDTPHFNVTMSMDMTRAMKVRAELNKGKEKSEKVSVNDLIVKACVRALRKYPAVNSSLLEDRIKYHADINIGIATALDTGLVVPVVLNADKLAWKELAAETKSIIKQARSGKLIGVGKGTFTVSNLGMFGIDEFTAIINPPEAAILAVGGLKQEVVSIDGTIGIKPVMKVTLCSDHRVVDGVLAAQFLQSLKRYLEEDISKA